MRRRAAAVRKFTRVVRTWDRFWKVVLRVGVQEFDVGATRRSRREAEWFRDQLCVALAGVRADRGRKKRG